MESKSTAGCGHSHNHDSVYLLTTQTTELTRVAALASRAFHWYATPENQTCLIPSMSGCGLSSLWMMSEAKS